MITLNKAKLVARTLEDKKGLDIKVIEVSNLTTLGDYFVIATGTSTTHVRSLCDDVEEALEKAGIVNKRIEGYASQQWILMDYYDVIVHIFQKETREFYALERLWADAPVLTDYEPVAE